ncbi:uncharacterized protein LOC144008020 [Festucalex cinctus]
MCGTRRDWDLILQLDSRRALMTSCGILRDFRKNTKKRNLILQGSCISSCLHPLSVSSGLGTPGDTDRTHWSDFNKVPVLERFVSSSISGSRGVVAGREIESWSERHKEE